MSTQCDVCEESFKEEGVCISCHEQMKKRLEIAKSALESIDAQWMADNYDADCPSPAARALTKIAKVKP